VLVLLVMVALAASLIAPHDPREFLGMDTLQTKPPSLAYPFGTDTFSRDVLTRVIYGARVSLTIAGVAVLVALFVGTAIGATAGFIGGLTDTILMRIVDGVLSVPKILILLIIATLVGGFTPAGLAGIIGLVAWPSMSRVVRAQVREVAARDYVLAARALGVSRARIFFRYVLPETAPQILVVATLAVATVIPLEAGLSYLGLGVPPATASWGGILREGFQQHLAPWWLILFPALAILVTVLSVNVLGERLREAIDPRLRPPL
jgi:peptide/nickel transport system permease protein